MTDLAGAVQVALFTKLSAVSGLPPVVSEVPIDAQGQAIYPFTLLGDDQITPVGGKASRLEQHDVAIHVCMQATKAQVRAKQQLVYDALNEQPISSASAILSNPIEQNANCPLLEDGVTYVGTQTYLIFAQPAG